MDTEGLAREILEYATGPHRLANAFRKGLALFARQQPTQSLAPFHHQRPGAVEDVRAKFR